MVWLILYYLLEALMWLIVIRALLSWFVPPTADNPLLRLLRRITDPILLPFSQMMPGMGGMDLSPLLAILAIYLLQMLLVRAQFYF
jgi:YggT family protein